VGKIGRGRGDVVGGGGHGGVYRPIRLA
jgi:hypothetical protein